MLAHLATHSDTKEEHICEVCGQIYRSRKLLNMHQRTHSDMRYKCEACGLLLKNSSTYRIHQRQHTGERPHQCSLCPKTFVTAPSYKKHLMVHNKIKPHACNICSGRFATLYHLKVHLNRHTGEKPYQCSKCSTRFSQPQSLNTHNKRFHQKNASNWNLPDPINANIFHLNINSFRLNKIYYNIWIFVWSSARLLTIYFAYINNKHSISNEQPHFDHDFHAMNNENGLRKPHQRHIAEWWFHKHCKYLEENNLVQNRHIFR